MPPPIDKTLKDSLAELEVDKLSKVEPEKPELSEAQKEKVLELKEAKKQEGQEAKKPEEKLEKPPLAAPPSLPMAKPKSQLYQRVEGILEEGLVDIYQKMPLARKQAFKKAGEETAAKITQLLEQVKVKVKEIFKLILRWLKIIPGVNRFYLEQEAKIKSDRILALKERMKQ